MQIWARMDKQELAKDMLEYVLTIGDWAERMREKHNLTPMALRGVLETAPDPYRAHQLHMQRKLEQGE